jgi:tripeptide aminopeptidase
MLGRYDSSASNVTMADANLSFDKHVAVQRLMDFLSIEGVTGQEQAIGRAVVESLLRAGVSRRAMRFDRANERIPLPTQTGNLIVALPGTQPGPRRLFMTHLDTVPLCAGAQPVRKGNRIVAASNTALGGDNRTGVACLVTTIATLLERRLPHGPLTFLFSVREESGLWGVRFVDRADLGGAVEAYNVDGRSSSEITIGAVGAERWEVEIRGRAAHAGAYPERGISATVVASIALADLFRDGWFGKITQNGSAGTANVGSFGGGDGQSAGTATNVVTDYVLIRGEARSHNWRFARKITDVYQQAFRNAARQVRDYRGRGARVRFARRLDYYPFRLKPSALVVKHALVAAQRAGLRPVLRITNGGLDANWMVRHGIPTITFGGGQNNPHTTDEYVDLPEFLSACRLALALAACDPSAGS